jgi:hypothetical protein
LFAKKVTITTVWPCKKMDTVMILRTLELNFEGKVYDITHKTVRPELEYITMRGMNWQKI